MKEFSEKQSPLAPEDQGKPLFYRASIQRLYFLWCKFLSALGILSPSAFVETNDHKEKFEEFKGQWNELERWQKVYKTLKQDAFDRGIKRYIENLENLLYKEKPTLEDAKKLADALLCLLTSFAPFVRFFFNGE